MSAEDDPERLSKSQLKQQEESTRKQLQIAPGTSPPSRSEDSVASLVSPTRTVRDEIFAYFGAASLDEDESQETSIVSTQVRPGAYRVAGIDGGGGDDDDNETTATPWGQIENDAGSPTQADPEVIARPVEAIPSASVAGFCSLTRRKIIFLIVIVLFVAIGLSVGLALGLNRDSKSLTSSQTVSPSFSPSLMPSLAPSPSPTLMPTAAPTYSAAPSISPMPTTAPSLSPIPANWTQLGQDLAGEANEDLFGASIAMSADGNIVAIGAPLLIGSTVNSGPGSVHVYIRNGTSWKQLGGVIRGENDNDHFGNSVTLSADGTVLAVGADGNDDNGIDSGQLRIFQLVNDAQWVQVGSAINGTGERDRFGASLALSADGTMMAVGAPYNDDNGFDSGHVRIFQLVNDEWSQIGSNLNGENAGDFFGFPVALSADGTVLAVGAVQYTDEGLLPGYVHVFRLVNDEWSQVGSTLNGKNAGDYFGYSVALSADGSVLAVGAPYNDDNGIDSGHVRIFRLENGDWSQVGSNLNGEKSYDWFGTSVALSDDGTVLVVGAPFANVGGQTANDACCVCGGGTTNGARDEQCDDTPGWTNVDGDGCSWYEVEDRCSQYGDYSIGSGHVRIFQLVNEDWAQVGSAINGKGEGDGFGASVALSADGKTVAAGANQLLNGGPGYVKIHHLVGRLQTPSAAPTNSAAPSISPMPSAAPTYSPAPSPSPTLMPTAAPTLSPIPANWTQLGQDLIGEANGDEFGDSIAMSADGNIVAVGAPWNDYNDATDSRRGSVHVYITLNGTSWNQLGGVIRGESADDWFGESIALSADGTLVAVGATGNGLFSGQVRIFQLRNENWSQIGPTLNGDNSEEYFGWSVALSSDGTVLAVGAIGTGYVRIFQLTNENWSQIGATLRAENSEDYFGWSVALSSDGTVLAASIPYSDSNGNWSGQVRIFRLVNDGWSQVGLNLSGKNADDQFGFSVAVSADGTVLAVGAPQYLNSGPGYVSIFQRVDNDWSQVGSNLNGENEHDEFGRSVALSADGTVLAVGARGNDDNGFQSGYVHIFQLVNDDWAQVGSAINGKGGGDYFGTSVALSADGKIVAGGATDDDEYVLVYQLEEDDE